MVYFPYAWASEKSLGSLLATCPSPPRCLRTYHIRTWPTDRMEKETQKKKERRETKIVKGGNGRDKFAWDCQIELARGTEKTDHAPIAETADKEAGPPRRTRANCKMPDGPQRRWARAGRPGPADNWPEAKPAPPHSLLTTFNLRLNFITLYASNVLLGTVSMLFRVYHSHQQQLIIGNQMFIICCKNNVCCNPKIPSLN